MQLNYFGALKLILAFLPGMRERKSGHIINVSSIGVQTNTPRFSAYVASKSALDAFSRCTAPEVVQDNVKFTTVYMPLVRTPMIAPTDIYKAFPTLTPEEAAQMLCDALIDKPKKMASRLGTFGELLYTISPKSVDIVLNTAYNLFPDSNAAKGKKKDGDEQAGAGGPEEGRRRDVHGGRRDGVPTARRALLAAPVSSALRLAALPTRAGAPAPSGCRPRRRRRPRRGSAPAARASRHARGSWPCSRFLPAMPSWRSVLTARQRLPLSRWSWIVTRAASDRR